MPDETFQVQKHQWYPTSSHHLYLRLFDVVYYLAKKIQLWPFIYFLSTKVLIKHIIIIIIKIIIINISIIISLITVIFIFFIFSLLYLERNNSKAQEPGDLYSSLAHRIDIFSTRNIWYSLFLANFKSSYTICRQGWKTSRCVASMMNWGTIYNSRINIEMAVILLKVSCRADLKSTMVRVEQAMIHRSNEARSSTPTSAAVCLRKS